MSRTPHAPNCDANHGSDCTCGTDELEDLVRCTEFAKTPWQTDMKLVLEGERAWPDLINKKVIHVTKGFQVAGLTYGTTGTGPAVEIRVDLPDGRVVILETSLRLFYMAAQALAARYGKP